MKIIFLRKPISLKDKIIMNPVEMFSHLSLCMVNLYLQYCIFSLYTLLIILQLFSSLFLAGKTRGCAVEKSEYTLRK